MVHELEEHGIKGCGGETGGVRALGAAAEGQQVEIMGILCCLTLVE